MDHGSLRCFHIPGCDEWQILYSACTFALLQRRPVAPRNIDLLPYEALCRSMSSFREKSYSAPPGGGGGHQRFYASFDQPRPRHLDKPHESSHHWSYEAKGKRVRTSRFLVMLWLHR